MRYDIAQGVADFSHLHVHSVRMIMSASGHPQVAVTSKKTPFLSWPERCDWSLTEIYVPTTQAVYMAANGEQLFIPKKLSAGVHDMLSREPFHHETFLHWWRSKQYYRDFWIETPHHLYRIHVTPRRSSFDPRSWQTAKGDLKETLLARLAAHCETVTIPCTTSALPLTHVSNWRDRSRSSSNIYGSDEAVLRDISSPLSRVTSSTVILHRPRMSSSQTSPWKMNKPELTSTLVAMGIPVRPDWTVPELRSILSEQKEKPSTSELKGLSSLKLDQLIQRCKDLNIKIPEKPTRGLLMRMIRDGVPPTDTEVVPFGRYRGYRFSEVPI